jgi:hypothetical protein
MAQMIGINVQVSGSCPKGHSVSIDVQRTVLEGSQGSTSSASQCTSCGRQASLTGSYSA